jgi:hypothetical protein
MPIAQKMIVDCALERQASYSVHGRKLLSCVIEVMRTPATQLARKVSLRCKIFCIAEASCDGEATNAITPEL